VLELMGGRKVPVQLQVAPFGGAPLDATHSEILRGLCFQRQRELLLLLQRELRRLLATPSGSTIRLPALARENQKLLQILCTRLGMKVEKTSDQAGAETFKVCMEDCAAVAVLPLEALVPRTWAGGDPASWSIVPRRDEAAVAQELTSVSDFGPFQEVSLSDETRGSSRSNVELKAAIWSLEEVLSDALPSSSAASADGEVATFSIDTSSEASSGFVVGFSAQPLTKTTRATLLAVLQGQEAGTPSPLTLDREDPYLLLFEPRPSERCFDLRGAFLSKLIKQAGTVSDPATVLPWASVSAGATNIWIASHTESDKGRRHIEVGSGDFPSENALKASVKAGPRFRHLGLAALGKMPGGPAPSSTLCGPVCQLRDVRVERGLLADRASEEHLLQLRWPGLSPDGEPWKAHPELKKNNARLVTAWFPMEGKACGKDEGAAPNPDHMAVCTTAEGLRSVRTEAIVLGWCVGRVGDEYLRHMAD